MGAIGDEVAGETDNDLAVEEVDLLLRTATNLAALRPRVTDKAAFDQLIRAVQISTAENEDAGELRDRIKAMGDGAIKLAKFVAQLVA
jgi:hypothetical protein